MVTLCYSGNLGLSHDLDTIVHAVGLANPLAEFHVRFRGGGGAKESLRNLVESLGLPNVEFCLPVCLSKLYDSLAEVDIHFMGQKHETVGLVVPSKIYGIMAVGRPTIFVGPDDSEIATLLHASESGIVVSPGDVEATANAIVKLVQNSKLRVSMGDNAKKHYQAELGRERSVARIIEAIEGVL